MTTFYKTIYRIVREDGSVFVEGDDEFAVTSAAEGVDGLMPIEFSQITQTQSPFMQMFPATAALNVVESPFTNIPSDLSQFSQVSSPFISIYNEEDLKEVESNDSEDEQK